MDQFKFREVCCTTYGRRAFSDAGPMAWNSLPDFIQDPTSSTDCFRHLLKKNLFVRHYCIQNIRGFSTIMHYTNPRTHTLDGFFGIGISLIRFRLGLCPGSRWRSLRRFPRACSQLGRGIPSPFPTPFDLGQL